MRKYTAYTYIKKLERGLRKLPFEEREDAINYFSEYFVEAGSASEQEIAERLGPPQRVAAEIMADAALRELNYKAERAARFKELRNAKKEERNSYRYTSDNLGPATVGTTEAETAGSNFGSEAEYETTTVGANPDRDAKDGANPKLRESLSASWLGTVGMLAMPVARPFAVLAFVLGIIGLVCCVIVVAAIFAIAGALIISGAALFVLSFAVLAQDPSVTVFFIGFGLANLGIGTVVFILNMLLGRAIFKGIANLSGRIRHKRVKVRKDAFRYNYTYGNTYATPGQTPAQFTAQTQAQPTAQSTGQSTAQPAPQGFGQTPAQHSTQTGADQNVRVEQRPLR
jgi:uncharacterized membrane protein